MHVCNEVGLHSIDSVEWIHRVRHEKHNTSGRRHRPRGGSDGKRSYHPGTPIGSKAAIAVPVRDCGSDAMSATGLRARVLIGINDSPLGPLMSPDQTSCHG